MEPLNPQNAQIEITPEFYQLLKQYTGSNDPLEDPNFDVAAYLNEKFPDFKSLDNINSLIEKFEKEIGELDEEIDGLMCERATYNDELKNYMQELNNDVGKIIQLISNIKQNTDTNETTVKLICNDIKNLDNARNNITVTISSLTKLIMLITGIEKLETFVKEKQYKEAANAIAASNDIMEYFKEYRHVTQVNSLYQKKDALCNSLLNTICDELKNDIGLLPANSDRLYDACLAINAIGDRAIGEIKTWFTQYKLAPYEQKFDPKIENAIEFKDTEQRFDWIKKALKEYDKIYDEVFPPSWGFKSQLCQEFCRITKLQLNEILMMNVEGVKNIEVEILVKVLNTTISFEKSLNEYLISEYPINEADKKNNNFLDMNVIEEIQSKYAEKKIRPPNRKDPNTKPRYRLFRVIGIISESFEPYMNSYVTNEEKKIKDIIINAMLESGLVEKLVNMLISCPTSLPDPDKVNMNSALCLLNMLQFDVVQDLMSMIKDSYSALFSVLRMKNDELLVQFLVSLMTLLVQPTIADVCVANGFLVELPTLIIHQNVVVQSNAQKIIVSLLKSLTNKTALRNQTLLSSLQRISGTSPAEAVRSTAIRLLAILNSL